MIKTFTLRLILFLSPIFIFLVSAHFAVFVETNSNTQLILQHQTSKLAEVEAGGASIEAIFVGDSSLGVSLDAVYFSELTQIETKNLALNGIYGYAGSYNMLRRAKRVSPDLKYVFIVHTFDMLQRPTAADGYIRSLDMRYVHELPRSEILEFPNRYFQTLLSRDALLASTLRRVSPLVRDIENDYVAQKDPLDEQDRLEANPVFRPETIRPEKTEYLRQIVKFAEAHDLTVIYMHGPIWDEIVENSPEYKSKADAVIAAENLVFLDEMLLLKWENLGDSIDHITPPLKGSSTEWYVEQLSPYLQESAQSR
ncbi:MAG: hypothetical protein AAF633_17720 [Chloroflexota bacterium]